MSIRDFVTDNFCQTFGGPPAFIARAPGRVNLLGEHVDYNDGFVMPAAINRETCVAFSPSYSDQTTLIAADYNEQAVFSSETLHTKTQPDGSPLPEWARYPAGVAWALGENGLAIENMQAVFASNVPRGSGLSSSASVEIAFAISWQTLGKWFLSPTELALVGQRAENKYVGVNCGIMDQFASACGEKDRLLYLDCRSLAYRTLGLPGALAIVIADTTIRRKLTDGEYNKRRTACKEAVRLLKQDLPAIQSLRDVEISDFNQLATKLPREIQDRARHVIEELERTRQAVALLEAGELKQFGGLINACHASLRDYYEVSCPELDIMARLAQSLPGCYGARLTGAGFGGCTVNLVASEGVDIFTKALATGYEAITGLHPEIYICEASQGARLI
jgi:galactokinase